MENASKALLIAGGVLLLILVLSFATFLIVKIGAQTSEFYKEMDETAQKILSEAEQKNAEYEEKLKNVDSEISQQKKKASMDIATMRSNAEAEAKETAAKIIEDAKKDAENQRNAIVESAKKDITAMVEDATRKVVLAGNTSEAYDMFLDNAERSDS